ncbi:MAG: CRISPR-associated protein Cas4 [Candidatus Edwardsbacteria bacterium]
MKTIENEAPERICIKDLTIPFQVKRRNQFVVNNYPQLVPDKSITGTLIWYYYICHREVWLMAHQLEPSQENPFIEIGKLISEESYSRERKQIHLENIVIDVLRRDDGQVIVGEVKKSSRFENSAKMQLAFYLYNLKEKGIEAKGELLFPREKKRIEIFLKPEIENEIKKAKAEIKTIIGLEKPPEAKKIRFCRKCGYQEFCWA